MNIDLDFETTVLHVEQLFESTKLVGVYGRIPSLDESGVGAFTLSNLLRLDAIPISIHVESKNLSLCIAGEIEFSVGMDRCTVTLVVVGQRRYKRA